MPDPGTDKKSLSPDQEIRYKTDSRPDTRPAPPLFVVGCERSGTTLLTVMLGRHRDIAMMPETHFFLRAVPKNFRRATAQVHRPESHEDILQRFWNSPRAADIGLDLGAIRSHFLQRTPTYPELFNTLLALYAERWDKKRAGEKTPFHLLRVPLILQCFPEARIVCIVRDGRDVVRSIMEAPWTAHRSLRRQAWKWTRCARLARDFLRDYPRSFHVVRYEDLVMDPETALRGINAFFNIEFDPGQLDAGGPSPVVPAHEQSWKSNAVERPDESRISAWRRHVTDAERLILNSMMGAELRTFGYDDTDAPAVSPGRRAVNVGLNLLCKAGAYRLLGNIQRTLLPRSRRRAEKVQGGKAAESWEEDAGADSGISHSAA
ncbi:MAG: sulfotransferase family protein [Phycisphaerae bacterium]